MGVLEAERPGARGLPRPEGGGTGERMGRQPCPEAGVRKKGLGGEQPARFQTLGCAEPAPKWLPLELGSGSPLPPLPPLRGQKLRQAIPLP